MGAGLERLSRRAEQVLRALARWWRRGRVPLYDPEQLALSLAAPPPRERQTTTEADAPLVRQLREMHAGFNARCFGGALTPVEIIVSRRMRSRLGHYQLVRTGKPGLIAISQRHIRRHGWDGARETLLHEMVHQWQDERGLPVDHGAGFRRMARAVGITPRATRRV